MSLTTARPEKPLAQQVSERMRRAEDERPCYTIRWTGMNVTVGRDTQRVLVAGITKRREYLRRGEVQTTYYVTESGCNCPDRCKARELGLERPCKHEYLASMDLAEKSGWPGEDGEYLSDEDQAEDTLALVAAGRVGREEIRRRMAVDFPAD